MAISEKLKTNSTCSIFMDMMQSLEDKIAIDQKLLQDCLHPPLIAQRSPDLKYL